MKRAHCEVPSPSLYLFPQRKKGNGDSNEQIKKNPDAEIMPSGEIW